MRSSFPFTTACADGLPAVLLHPGLVEVSDASRSAGSRRTTMCLILTVVRPRYAPLADHQASQDGHRETPRDALHGEWRVSRGTNSLIDPGKVSRGTRVRRGGTGLGFPGGAGNAPSRRSPAQPRRSRSRRSPGASAGESPSIPKPSSRQRSPGSGGSLTSSRPPTRSRGAAHSATTAGGPNERAMTASAVPRRDRSRPTSSARAWITSNRSASPRRRPADTR